MSDIRPRAGGKLALEYRSEALASVHGLIQGLHHAGAIDARTMREFNTYCLADQALTQTLDGGVLRTKSNDPDTVSVAEGDEASTSGRSAHQPTI